MGHKATTTLLHMGQSFAVVCILPHENPMSSSPAITVFRHIDFGRPSFLLLGGVHLRATFVILSLCFLRTCPSHLNRCYLISRTALLQPVSLWSSTLDSLLGQNICQIFHKHPLWKASIFAMSLLTTRQPQSKIHFTRIYRLYIYTISW